MKKLTLLALALITALTACNQGGRNTENNERAEMFTTDCSVVYVYYFRGKARCKTCIAVHDVTKATVEQQFAGKNNVQFLEISTDDKFYEALVQQYEVTWNALIITKGKDFVEITKEAFATAVRNPQELENLIKGKVTWLLMNKCCDIEKLALCDKVLTCEKCCKVDCCKILTGKTYCETPDKMPCESVKSSCSTDKKGCC